MNKKSIISTVIVFIVILFLLIGCGRLDCRSTTPTVFVISKKYQTSGDKNNHVARYKIDRYYIYTEGSYGYNTEWHTLQENFEVGDTLQFVKK
jgi:hypothetical protein